MEIVDEIIKVSQATQRQDPAVQTVQTNVDILQRQFMQVIVEVVDVRQSILVILQCLDDQREASPRGSSCTREDSEVTTDAVRRVE